MASIDSLKASDGSGNAAVATIQNVRSAGATTLVVDTVQGINSTFHATMGTPHTFVDPVTSETITVISEATAVDFKGHVDGTNLEIDTIAPGFTDNGSAVGDIVIIKPTTQWADEVANVLEVSHEDDGTLKANTVDTTQLVDEAVTPAKLGTNTWVAKHTSSVSLSTSDTTVVTVTVPVVNGRTYKVTGSYYSATGSTSAGVHNNFIDDSTSNFASVYSPRLGTGSQVGATVVGTYTASSTGNITFRLRVSTTQSTSTLNADAARPATIIVEAVSV